MEHTERDVWHGLSGLPNWVTYAVLVIGTIIFWALILKR